MSRLISLLMVSVLGSSMLAEDCTEEPTPVDTVTVVAIDGVHQQFGDGDTRTIEQDVEFPQESDTFRQILMHYTLSCPEGGCDPWDRTAYVNVISEREGEDALNIEVGRYITPYGVGYSWTTDVTELRPILMGSRTVQSFIDTWVNPGWIVDVSFEFVPGVPERRAVSIVPLQRGYYTYGNADDPIENSLTPVSKTLPEGITDGMVRVLATGHGFGYTDNCAEFCPKEHTLLVGDESDMEVLWRDDCVMTGAPDQAGTWWYARAGWCPGADVKPRKWEVGDLISAGENVDFSYEIEPYVNTVEDGNPYVILSAYLVLFE